MLAKDIHAYEKRFLTTGTDSSGRQFMLNPLQVGIPGSSERLSVIRCKPADGDESFYYKESFPKHRIVIHFTAGYLNGDMTSLTKRNYHVSVPFLIARDGTIYNLFSSAYWSYHLGPGAIGGNEEMSKVSLGVELSNIGPLESRGNGLYTHTNKRYCGLHENQYFETKSYRGFQYYATFTDRQYESLSVLLRYLTAKYNIPYQIPDASWRLETKQGVEHFYGICSHVNFRTDKFDIGPVFKWEEIV